MNQGQSFVDAKIALLSLKSEIDEAKEERKRAKLAFEKAIAEGAAADIRADLKSLLNSATLELERLSQKESKWMEWMKNQDSVAVPITTPPPAPPSPNPMRSLKKMISRPPFAPKSSSSRDGFFQIPAKRLLLAAQSGVILLDLLFLIDSQNLLRLLLMVFDMVGYWIFWRGRKSLVAKFAWAKLIMGALSSLIDLNLVLSGQFCHWYCSTEFMITLFFLCLLEGVLQVVVMIALRKYWHSIDGEETQTGETEPLLGP